MGKSEKSKDIQIIERAQHYMRERGGKEITRDDVARAQQDVGATLTVKQK